VDAAKKQAPSGRHAQPAKDAIPARAREAGAEHGLVRRLAVAAAQVAVDGVDDVLWREQRQLRVHADEHVRQRVDERFELALGEAEDGVCARASVSGGAAGGRTVQLEPLAVVARRIRELPEEVERVAREPAERDAPGRRRLHDAPKGVLALD
jgi:hypothetical protein